VNSSTRSVWSEIDLDALRANVRALCSHAAPAELLAVVKANGYGHGAVPVARAALTAGASWLGVARVEEGVQLREAGIEAPVMILSEPSPAAVAEVVAHDITPVVYTEAGIDALAKGVAEAGHSHPFPVHLKVDTGMHRVGCAPDDAVALARQVAARDELALAGVCTHLAVADEPEDAYTRGQLDRFDAVLAALDDAHLRPALVHAANSAGLLAHPRAHHSLVRVGIAMYGLPPAPGLPDDAGVVLAPVMSLRARVTLVKDLPAGERLSYGLRYELDRPSRVATVPAGYADGVPRNLGLQGGEVLIGGRRLPIAGVITMDQLLVDVGDAPVAPGDEVVLIGRQGAEEITATEWAQHLGTINYEIVTGIGARVPRTYRGDQHS
jgi:alanine racemase